MSQPQGDTYSPRTLQELRDAGRSRSELPVSMNANRESQKKSVTPQAPTIDSKLIAACQTTTKATTTTPNPNTVSVKSQALADADLGKQINSKYDQLNQLWVKAEDNLRQFQAPYTVEYRYQSYVDHEVAEHVANNLKTHDCLGWTRIGTQWRICIASYTDSPFGDDEYGPCIDWKPITESAIWYRQSMTTHFPKLRDKVIEAAKNTLQEIEDAISELSSMLD